MKILLVDDEPILRRSLERMIRRMGHDVCCASDGDEALALNDGIALALIDIKLPGMSGVSLVERLRQKYPGLPAILMSGDPKPQHVREQVLTKPFGREELGAAISQVVDRERDAVG